MRSLKRGLMTTAVLAGIAFFLYGFLTSQYRQGEPSLAGSAAKNFTFQMDGKAQQLNDLRGKVVVLNFWASWCPPCAEETPALNHLEDHIRSKGGMVLAVSVDDDPAAYRKFLDEYKVDFPTWRDPSRKVPVAYGTTMFPETYVIGRNGRILRKIIGPQDWDSPQMLAYFDSVLAQKG
jgi:cytochrome c biogenesis protein CcmG, thiol:disulfide interchange protein DsbE